MLNFMQETLSVWELLQQTKKPIVLYGMGNGADKIIDWCEANEVQVQGVFASDEFVRGQQFRGFTVERYDALRARLGNDLLVVIAFASERPEVLERFAQLAAEQEVVAPHLPLFDEEETVSAAWLQRYEEQLAQISEKVNGIVAKLKALGISVKFDNADNKKPGWKFAEYELKGVPVRLAMGGRDLENNTIEVMRRDTLEKETVTCNNIETYVQNLLEEIQKNIFQKALDHRTEKTITVDTYEEFKEKIEEGYFIMAHWDGTPETEEQVKNETKATIRCIPLEGDKTPGKCMVTGRPSAQRVLFARAY